MYLTSAFARPKGQEENQCRAIFNKFLKKKMETPETIRTSLQMGVGHVHRFKGAYFHIKPIKKISEISCTGQNIPVLSTWSVHSSFGVHCSDQEAKLLAFQKGIRIDQYLDNWLVRARTHQTCLQHTQTLIALCQDLGWLVNMEKLEMDSKQVFDFVGYQFDMKDGKVRPTLERWQTLATKIREFSIGLYMLFFLFFFCGPKISRLSNPRFDFRPTLLHLC